MKVLIADKIHENALELFEKNGIEYVNRFNISQTELKKEIEDFDAIIVRSRTKLTADILEKAKKLKVIGRAGKGLDNIDLKKAKELNIKVINTPKAPAVSVAELTFGLIICLARHIIKADKTTHCGQWCKNEYMGFILSGKKLGIIGFGNIGEEVAKRAKAFDMIIGVFDNDKNAIKKANDLGYFVYETLEDLVVDSQIITLHVPASDENKNIINKSIIDLMQKDTIFINTARGDLVDENALIIALKQKKIKGVALDVFKNEPKVEQELCNCEENLILTPHIGSQTIETQIYASTSIVKKIIKYLEGYKRIEEKGKIN
ncbi:MAG: hydroxyacid dehydrogenase [Promethearchaeota archaeon]